MYQNVRGIKSKMESLLDKIDEIEPTIFCITEAHLLPTEEVKVEGYRIYPNFRDNYGGGLLIGVRKELEKVTTVVAKETENAMVKVSGWLSITVVSN